MRVARDGASVEFDVRGESGDVIVMAHNLLASRAIFDDCLVRLGAKYRAVAVDLRAHGGSRAEKNFSTRDLAGDLVAVLDALGAEKATFVGVSLGGCAAMEAALAHPSRVARLVLCGATARAARPADAAGARALGLAARIVGMRAGIVKKVTQALFGPSFRSTEPAKLAAWEDRIAKMPGRDVARATRSWATRPRLLDRIGAIRVPTLLLVGDEDAPCPRPHSDEIAAKISGARVETIARAGHTLPLERPEETASRIASFIG